MAKDRFKIPLKCDTCGRQAIALAEEQDGPAYLKDSSTRITSLPDGFKVVDQPSRMASVDIFCTECDMSAV